MSNPDSEAQKPAQEAQPADKGWFWIVVGLLFIWLVNYFSQKPKPRVFISFSSTDMGARDLLVRQSQFEKTPWTLEDGSLHVPFDERTWKREVKPMITSCDILLLLIGPRTCKAKGAIWEVECARAAGIPVIGMYIKPEGGKRGRVPECMANEQIINWKFDELQEVMSRFG